MSAILAENKQQLQLLLQQLTRNSKHYGIKRITYETRARYPRRAFSEPQLGRTRNPNFRKQVGLTMPLKHFSDSQFLAASGIEDNQIIISKDSLNTLIESLQFHIRNVSLAVNLCYESLQKERLRSSSPSPPESCFPSDTGSALTVLWPIFSTIQEWKQILRGFEMINFWGEL